MSQYVTWRWPVFRSRFCSWFTIFHESPFFASYSGHRIRTIDHSFYEILWSLLTKTTIQVPGAVANGRLYLSCLKCTIYRTVTWKLKGKSRGLQSKAIFVPVTLSGDGGVKDDFNSSSTCWKDFVAFTQYWDRQTLYVARNSLILKLYLKRHIERLQITMYIFCWPKAWQAPTFQENRLLYFLSSELNWMVCQRSQG